jgi:CMP-N-acetylneuraminic acid synthetase
MNILAVILARAGSSGLKDKHVIPLLGKPVIQYTFEHARAASSLTRVVVSTDCPKVKKLAERSWFETVNRPRELATAEASVQDVMLHAMETVEERSDFRAEGCVVLYGNVPIRNDNVIDRAVDLLETTGCDSVRSFCPVGKWHPDWMCRLEKDGVASPVRHNSIDSRHHLEPLFLHDGAVVAVSRDALLRGKSNPHDPHAFFGLDRRAIRTLAGETVEIDTPLDLHLAEAVLRARSFERSSENSFRTVMVAV